jgi:hypothetical protein
MNADRRYEIMQELVAAEEEIFEVKGREYTLGAEKSNDKDTLANFKNVGSMVQHTCSGCGHMEPIGPRAAWAVYFLKHVFSVMTHAGDPTRKISESILGRIHDIRTYGTLYACIDEDEASQASVAEVGEPMLVDVAIHAKSPQMYEDL